MTINSPIGIFDSGVGGLSVWKELYRILPNEHFIYFADSKYCPYGSKSQEEIIHRSVKIVDYFISRGAKMVVVACNTATAAAIDYLRSHYDIPFIGMEPAIKPAASLTKSGAVGVLATEGTFKGRLFNETSQKYAGDIQVETVVGKGFVELVESCDFDSENANQIVKDVLSPLLNKEIDHLVLACTHYPFLEDTIRKYTNPRNIEIINPAFPVAKHTKTVLKQNTLISKDSDHSKNEFYSSLETNTLEHLVDRIIKTEHFSIHRPIFEIMDMI